MEKPHVKHKLEQNIKGCLLQRGVNSSGKRISHTEFFFESKT